MSENSNNYAELAFSSIKFLPIPNSFRVEIANLRCSYQLSPSAPIIPVKKETILYDERTNVQTLLGMP